MIGVCLYTQSSVRLILGGPSGAVYLRVCPSLRPRGHHGNLPQQRTRQEEEVVRLLPYFLCPNEVHPDQQGEECQPQICYLQGKAFSLYTV